MLRSRIILLISNGSRGWIRFRPAATSFTANSTKSGQQPRTIPDDYLPERVGLQPYITMEVFGRLKAAFVNTAICVKPTKPTAPVEQAIVLYAGWLGHYVADGSQPLHTTIHYNGWVGPNPNGYTTEHGIHAKFESTYVAENITPKDFAKFVHAPERLADPFSDYVAYLRESSRHVEKVYAIEKAGGFNGKGSPEAFEFTTHRLAAGSQMLLNLWYTAWRRQRGQTGDCSAGRTCESSLLSRSRSRSSAGQRQSR